MKTVCLVLGDQLFEKHPAIELDCDFAMIETNDFCDQYKYHKFKLVYTLTCMREYRDFLRLTQKNVDYRKLDEGYDLDKFIGELSNKYEKMVVCEITDKKPRSKIRELAGKYNLGFEIIKSKMFLTSTEELKGYKKNLGDKKPLMNSFYIYQRRRLNLFIRDSKPWGGKWSLDEDNRKKYPKDVEYPVGKIWEYKSKNYDEVKKLILEKFPNNPGIVPDLPWLPINSKQSKKHLDEFLDNRLELFGDYQDAMSSSDDFGHHSTISGLLNNGLLTPDFVINRIIAKLKSKPELSQKHFNSIEGLIRQIIGWREWMRYLYEFEYEEDREYNFFGSKNDLPKYFWNYELDGIEQNTPLYTVLERVNRLSWCNHIERLMILGNWMTLNKYNPRQCYEWFMAMFIDARNWVMMGNVYGMGLFADGGIFATKPYISGGNYIKKMSNYKNSKKWEPLWTEKFWDFLFENEEFFAKNPRMNILIQNRKKNL